MQSQFSKKLSFIAQIKMTFKLIFILLCLGHTSISWANQAAPKATWYRYYDNKGVANISTNVTPNHIRHGYEALDQNMQVIKRNNPYNAEADVKKAPQRAEQAIKREQDEKLKRAYTNSQVALSKRNDALRNIKKQILFQQEQLKQLQNDRIMFKRQEMEFTRKAKPVPAHLKSTLEYNQVNLNNRKKSIHNLQTRYRKTQADYDKIIKRLKELEDK